MPRRSRSPPLLVPLRVHGVRVLVADDILAGVGHGREQEWAEAVVERLVVLLGVRVVRRGVGARLEVRPSILHRRSHAEEGAAPRAVVRQPVEEAALAIK